VIRDWRLFEDRGEQGEKLAHYLNLLYNPKLGILPEWRNGRRSGLKIQKGQIAKEA